jgi:aminoglycoside phosphotransferase (APT) family kinase protein
VVEDTEPDGQARVAQHRAFDGGVPAACLDGVLNAVEGLGDSVSTWAVADRCAGFVGVVEVFDAAEPCGVDRRFQVGGPGVRFYVADDAAPQAHVEAVVDALAMLHGRFWKSPRFASDLAWLAPISRRPGSPVMNRLFRWSAQRFFTQDRDVPVAVRRITEQFVDNQATLLRAWESMPPTLCHGDMHLGNTFSTPDGTAGIYDWQVCHRMNGLRDFSYFLTHSIPTDLRRREERNLLARYLDGLAQAGAGRETPSVDDAFNCYRVLTVYGWMAVVVTLAAGGLQPDDRMEVAARRAATTLIDLDVEGALAAQLDGALRLPH